MLADQKSRRIPEIFQFDFRLCISTGQRHYAQNLFRLVHLIPFRIVTGKPEIVDQFNRRNVDLAGIFVFQLIFQASPLDHDGLVDLLLLVRRQKTNAREGVRDALGGEISFE